MSGLELTHKEARAAYCCAQAIVTAGYRARLRADSPAFVEAVAATVAEMRGVSLDVARRELVAKHGAILDLGDERTADVMPWLPPYKTISRSRPTSADQTSTPCARRSAT
jgi:hypothetical protein